MKKLMAATLAAATLAVPALAGEDITAFRIGHPGLRRLGRDRL